MNTDEPIYTYVKGEGWLIEPTIIATDREGKQAKLYKRDPKPGEQYFKVHDDDFDYLLHVKRYALNQFPVWRADYQYLGLIYYVLVPL